MKNILYIYAIALLLFSGQVLAAPFINSVTGNVYEDSTVSISATGNGSLGPTLLVFDDFDGGVTGEAVSLTADTGTWTSYGTIAPIYDVNSNSGSHSMRIYDFVEGAARHIKKEFPSKVTEFFTAYWVSVPTGSYYPSQDPNQALEEFPLNSDYNLSVWKYMYLMNNDVSDPGGTPGDSDIVLPTSVGNLMYLAGNSINYPDAPRLYWGPQPETYYWWKWGGMNRISTWLRADEANPSTVDGVIWASAVSTQQHYEVVDTRPIFDAPGTEPPYQWGWLNVPGWIRTSAPNDTRPVYDDFYCASGPGAAARVEIGDAETYTNCVNIAISVVKAWEDGTVIAEIKKGSFTTGGAFLFVFNSDNEPSDQDLVTPGAQGFRVTFGEGGNGQAARTNTGTQGTRTNTGTQVARTQ